MTDKVCIKSAGLIEELKVIKYVELTTVGRKYDHGIVRFGRQGRQLSVNVKRRQRPSTVWSADVDKMTFEKLFELLAEEFQAVEFHKPTAQGQPDADAIHSRRAVVHDQYVIGEVVRGHVIIHDIRVEVYRPLREWNLLLWYAHKEQNVIDYFKGLDAGEASVGSAISGEKN